MVRLDGQFAFAIKLNVCVVREVYSQESSKLVVVDAPIEATQRGSRQLAVDAETKLMALVIGEH